MGNNNSAPEHAKFQRGQSTGSLRHEIARRSRSLNVSGTTALPPGAVRTESMSRVLRQSSTERVRRNSLEGICAPGSCSSSLGNTESAYSSTRLLHAPRLRLNSVPDAVGAVTAPTLRQRRDSIHMHNQEHLQLMLNMEDDVVEDLGRKARIYVPVPEGLSPITKTGRKRRNSSNSIFLTQTADNILDQKALVKCTCAAIHAAIEEAPGRATPEYAIFVDPDHKFFCRPTFREVFKFVNNIYQKAQLEAEVLIISLVYFDRLRTVMEAQLVLGYRNWRAIVLACCVLASKVWDDLSMINADFSCIMGQQFSLKQINKLEVAMLSALKFDVKVSLSTYALYYFKLRAMLGPGNLFHDEATLSIRAAHKMKALSPSYTKRLSITDQGRRRTSTIGTNEGERARRISMAALEHIVRRSPRHGDDDREDDSESYPDTYRLAARRKKEDEDEEGCSKKSPAVVAEASETDSGNNSSSSDGVFAVSSSNSPVAETSESTTVEVASSPGETITSPIVRISSQGSDTNSSSEEEQAVEVKKIQPRRQRGRRRERRPELVAEDPNALYHASPRQHVEL